VIETEVPDIRECRIERLNLAPSGKRFYAEFITPGLISYRDVKGGVDLIRKETLDRDAQSMMGAALTIKHPAKELIISRNFTDVSHGKVDKVGYNEKTGFYFAEGDVETDAARERINAGDGVSCGFTVLQKAPGGTWNQVPFTQEDKHLEFHHLALVERPRIEEADIRLNSKSAMKIFGKLIKKLVTGGKTEEVASDINLATTVDVGDGKTATIQEMIDAERANAIHVVSGEDYVEHEGMRYNCAELIANYKANCMRSNEAAEKKKKDEADKLERENALKIEAEQKAAKEKADKEAAEAKAATERENARKVGAAHFQTLHDANRKPNTPPPEITGFSGSLEDGVALGRERYGKPLGGRN
jgi:hypothetical protein